MSKDGSVAPKERINIRYKADTGDANEEVELPFRMMVVGDFTGKNEETPIEHRDVISVDKDNFNEVLKARDVSLDATVANKIAGEDSNEELSLSLKFEEMQDFSPDSVAKQIPELKQLLELREALNSLKGPLGNVPNFRKRLEAILDDPEARKRLLAEIGQGEED